MSLSKAFFGWTAFVLLLATRVAAAVITWSGPTNIVADTDIYTNGNFEYGGYFTTNTATLTINGVTFTGSGGSHSFGANFYASFPSGGSYYSGLGAGTGLSTNYQTLLGGCVYGGSTTNSITLNNLKIGYQYFVQLWINDSRSSGAGRSNTVTSGNSVTLDYNNTDAVGGKGQFAIGTFVADYPILTFYLQSKQSGQFNALQLRSLPATAQSLAPITNVTVGVNASQIIRTVDKRLFSLNTAIYDGSLQGASSVPLLFEMNNQALRWPGGSYGDSFLPSTEASRPSWQPRTTNFLYIARHTGAETYMIANYGTGQPSDAADWVRICNITNAAGCKYWEIGNEIPGTWENDNTAPPFTTADILDLPSLANKLYAPSNNISTYLRSTLSTTTLTTLTNYMSSPATYDAALRSALVSEINDLDNNISPSSIYKTDPTRFNGVTLRAVTLTNLSLPIPNAGQDLNNRMTIEDAYPTELAKITPAINLASNWPDVYLPHDPWTYAQRFAQYYAQMKAVDPTIKIGAVGDTSESGNVNGYTHHYGVNLRTGTTNYAWMPVMLSTLRSLGVTPDFVVYHNYAGSGDAALLQWSSRLTNDAASMRQLCSDYSGSPGTNTELSITETGPSGSDQSSTSLVGGLFYADNSGQALLSGFTTRLWWSFRNGGSAVAANTNIYGWRNVQDYGMVAGSGSPTSNRYPTFYCFKLLQNWARGGEQVVAVSNSSPLLATYAVKRPDGALALLVVNKSPSPSVNGTFNLTGFAAAPNVTVYSYGIPQDETVRTNGTLSPDIAVTNFLTASSSSVSYSFAPYSANVMVLCALDQNVVTRNFRMRITFPNYNRSETLTNFPVLVILNTNLPGFSYSSFASPTAGDLRFKSADGLADLNYEIETWNPRGNSFVWVQIPRFTNNVSIIAQWGGTQTTPPAGTTNGAVWTNGYVGVWHLNGLTAVDSAQTNDAVVDGTPTVLGCVGVGATFNNTTSDTIQIPWSSGLNVSNNFEISGWFKIAASDKADYRTLIAKETNNPSTDRNWWIATRADGKLWWKSGVSSGTAIDLMSTNKDVCDGVWHHFAASHEGSVARLLVDGVQVASLASPGNASVQSAPLQFGEELGAGRYFLGQLDELRVSIVRRSTNWIWASCQTVASNASFGVVGAVTGISLVGTNLIGSLLGNSMQLSWPADHTGWRLQAQTNSLTKGLGTNWTDVPAAVATNQISIPMNQTNGGVFYRMVFP
jgi:hypothetical protein